MKFLLRGVVAAAAMAAAPAPANPDTALPAGVVEFPKAPKPDAASDAAAADDAAVGAFDVRELPRPPGAQTPMSAHRGQLMYRAAGTVGTVYAFYRARLAALGWERRPSDPGDQENYANADFSKDGVYLTLNISRHSQADAEVLVSLKNAGKIDTMSLPRFPGAAEQDYSKPTLSFYTAPAGLPKVLAFTRAELAGLGWQEYRRPNTSYHEDPNWQSLVLKKDGVQLDVSLRSAADDADATAVQYSSAVLADDLPAPADAAAMEFDATGPYLRYTTAADFDAVFSFYRQRLPALGWAEHIDMQVAHADCPAGFFVRDGRLMALELERSDAGDSSVTLKPVPGKYLVDRQYSSICPGAKPGFLRVVFTIDCDGDAPVYIDGEAAGTISFPGALTLELSPGSHQLSFDADGVTGSAYEIRPDATLTTINQITECP